MNKTDKRAKRSRWDSYTTNTRKIEELYFHTGNSGLTVRILETKTQYASPEELESEQVLSYSGDVNYKHKLEFIHGASGHSSTLSVPLLHPEMVDFQIEMLTRLRARMDNLEAYKPFYHSPHKPDFSRVVQCKDGLELREVWSEEIVTSQNSSSTMLLGFDLLDAGRRVGFEPYAGPEKTRGSASSGSYGPLYSLEDIGKPVAQVQKLERSPFEQIGIQDAADQIMVPKPSKLKLPIPKTTTRNIIRDDEQEELG